jgi:hypothetical protein
LGMGMSVHQFSSAANPIQHAEFNVDLDKFLVIFLFELPEFY